MKKVNKTPRLHKIPQDFKKTVESDPKIQSTWDDLTPLARNEWICWICSAKKEETRLKRIQRARDELKQGKRRPCCWPGCPHRRPNAQKWFSS